MKMDKKNRLNNFKFHFIFELIFIALFIVIFALELSKKISCDLEEFPIIDIIVILLPTIITIISISLSLSNEKILNLKRCEFAKLLSGWHYDFLTMIIDVVAIFVLYTICEIKEAKISALVLEGISIFYSIYFSCTEIPMLTQNYKRINKIIKKNYYKNKQIDYEFSHYEKQGILNIALRQLVFENGIKCTYFALKNKKHDPVLLDSLLSLQNNLLFDVVEDSALFKENLVTEYKGLDLDLTTIIDTFFSDIEDIFSFSKDFNIQEIYGSEKDVYLMARCLFCLHRICQKFELNEKEKTKLDKILFKLLTISNKDDDRNEWRYSFMNSMIASSISEGEFWFATALRDYDYPGFLFSFDGNLIGFFYLIYCFYISKISNFASPELKKDVENFCNERSKGLNCGGVSWKEYAKREIERCNDSYAVSSINSLLKIYNSSKASIFYISKRDPGVAGFNCEDNFNKHLLLNVWLEIILFNIYFRPSPDVLRQIIESFSDEDKKNLIYVLSKEWLENNELKQRPEVGFLSFIGLKADTTVNYGNKEAIEVLASFRQKYLKEREDSKIQNEMPKDLQKYKNIFRNYFNEGMLNNPIIDKSIDVGEEQRKYISLRMPVEGLDYSIIQYKSLLKDYFDKYVRLQILENIKPSFFILDYSFSKSEADKIISFKPDYMTANEWIFHEAGVETSKIEIITKISSSYLPRFLFWKKDGISANFEYCDEESQFRPLNDKEINYIIDNEFTSINGLYKYGRYGEDDINSILISREELFNNLSRTQYLSVIVFKAKVNLDPSKLMFVKHKSEVDE